MLVSTAVEDYSFYILKHSPATQVWYLARLKAFAEWCDARSLQLEQIKAVEIRRYIEELRTKVSDRTGEKLSSYTVHGHARSIRTFLNWCSKEDGLEDLVSDKLIKRIEMPKLDTKIIQIFSDAEIKRLLKACSKEFLAELVARDEALLLVLLDSGARNAEICGLTLEHVFITPQDAYIQVLGKGRREREIGLGQDSRAALRKYINRYRKADQAIREVFLSRFHQPLTVNGLDQILYRLAAWAKVEDCHAHKFRHHFAVKYLEAGGDLFKLSRLLGHTDTKTTQNYLKAFSSRQARQGGISVVDSLK